jgi:hypothetical protein
MKRVPSSEISASLAHTHQMTPPWQSSSPTVTVSSVMDTKPVWPSSRKPPPGLEPPFARRLSSPLSVHSQSRQEFNLPRPVVSDPWHTGNPDHPNYVPTNSRDALDAIISQQRALIEQRDLLIRELLRLSGSVPDLPLNALPNNNLGEAALLQQHMQSCDSSLPISSAEAHFSTFLQS